MSRPKTHNGMCNKCRVLPAIPRYYVCVECQRQQKQEWWAKYGYIRTLKSRMQSLKGSKSKLRAPDETCVICGCVEHAEDCGIGMLNAQMEEVLSNWERQCNGV